MSRIPDVGDSAFMLETVHIMPEPPLAFPCRNESFPGCLWQIGPGKDQSLNLFFPVKKGIWLIDANWAFLLKRPVELHKGEESGLRELDKGHCERPGNL